MFRLIKLAPIYNFLLILLPFILFLIGNDDSTNLNQKIIVLSFALVVLLIFFTISLVVNFLFPVKKIWIIPFLSISTFIGFSYAQWNLDNKIYVCLFLLVPFLLSILISRIYILEKFFSAFVCTVVAVLSVQLLYLQYIQLDFDSNPKKEVSLLLDKNKVSITPNIYLVILDAYAREDSLSELGFDNSQFLNFLRSKDFYVADKSNANYISTRLSLYTLYMMEYPGEHISLKSPELADVLKGRNTVTSNLRSIGYSHVRMGPNQSFPQDCSGLEDLCLYKINEINGTAYGQGNIYIHILSMSPLLKVIKYLNLFPEYTNPDRYEKATIQDAIDNLTNKSSKLNSPFFVEINVWQPHAPYLFESNCDRRKEIITGFNSWDESSKVPYIDEVKCANSQLVSFVNNLTTTDEEAIVIIMSDHGHSFFFDREVKVEDYSDASMRARLANLISAKLPPKCSNYLYSTITPVNVFPIIYSCLTNSEPKLLEDFSYKHQLGNDHKSDEHILVNTLDP